ncbi:MBL fold metallo-hydrolase [Hufsiella ginkgonis]|uniref:Exonuclease n=1 Tax=Hufsiella ginkgonis TaxID=2695274 RepID=A0A7K1XYQ0_9SPHI|nr:MBL fold metallo-hydrolase [Hufsiella ginkgonis]MXV15869.1 exonuclease [Hufsiella ginkgonis]
MIVPDFLVINENGIYCRPGNFYLDPQLPVQTAVISHAHNDHAVKGNRAVYCTPSTKTIMELRHAKNHATQFNTVGYREPFSIGDVTVTFIPAGHILGSAQVVMEYAGARYLYTGDVKLQADPTCEPAAFCKADVLITETTFADPAVSHPDQVSEIEKLSASPHNILLGAYSLGKSQRLISLLNRHCPEKTVLVHRNVLSINRVYESFGYPPGKYLPYSRKLIREAAKNYVYIVPPLTFNSYFRAKNVLRVFASGWKKLHHQNDITLLISDHADWNDILAIITEVEPKEVWTLHGDGRHLAHHFQDRPVVKILNKC